MMVSDTLFDVKHINAIFLSLCNMFTLFSCSFTSQRNKPQCVSKLQTSSISRPLQSLLWCYLRRSRMMSPTPQGGPPHPHNFPNYVTARWRKLQTFPIKISNVNVDDITDSDDINLLVIVNYLIWGKIYMCNTESSPGNSLPYSGNHFMIC